MKCSKCRTIPLNMIVVMLPSPRLRVLTQAAATRRVKAKTLGNLQAGDGTPLGTP